MKNLKSFNKYNPFAPMSEGDKKSLSLLGYKSNEVIPLNNPYIINRIEKLRGYSKLWLGGAYIHRNSKKLIFTFSGDYRNFLWNTGAENRIILNRERIKGNLFCADIDISFLQEDGGVNAELYDILELAQENY